MYLYKSKTPGRILEHDWDYFELISTIKPEDAFRPLDKWQLSTCEGVRRQGDIG